MLLVETANRLALAGLGALLLSLTGMVVLIVDVVFGAQWAAVGWRHCPAAVHRRVGGGAPLGLARYGRFPKNPPPDAPVACGRLVRGRADD